MCGLTGVLSSKHAVDALTLAHMAAAIRHRGPDDEGVWLDPAAGIGLAHRRLSIQDLSPAGHQPMVSASGRYVTVFNGEIYNHLELRETLAGPWRGHSDTETLLAAVEAWGFAETLRRTTGMFAIALWDREERRLLLARDRIGEKPLYYGWRNGALLFGSELSALRRHPAFAVRGDGIDRDALTLLLRNNYIPAPYSIYQGIRKLPPGTWLEARLSDTGAPIEHGPTAYWSFYEAVARGEASPLALSDQEAIERVESTLQDIVRGQLISDVPLGAFLSGGIDSSTIVALMQRVSSRPVRTFTIGFHEEAYDEAQHARAVAQHLGTDHTELYITPEDALAVIPELPTIYSEPFSDASQVPTFLVSKLARQHVTVSLSGDAGDELFCGYKRYFDTPRIWGRFAGIPAPLRRAIAGGIRTVGPARWGALHRGLRWAMPGGLRDIDAVRKSRRVAEVMSLGSAGAAYEDLIAHWHHPEQVVLGSAMPPTALSDPAQWPATSSFEHHMMAVDTMSYLPDDILVKVDRAAMAVSLETRVPFLDQRMVELAWQLPLSMKIRDGQGKWILRRVLERHVPRTLIERPKMGFAIPLEHWLRGPLRDWAEALISESRLRREGYFDAKPIRAMWDEHLSGREDRQYPLWDVLMFQAWMDAQRD